MERIQALIDKLYQQKSANGSAAQLLLTVELLRSELLRLQQRNGTLGTAKVAVTLPMSMNFTEEEVRPVFEETAPAPVPAPQPQQAVIESFRQEPVAKVQEEPVAKIKEQEAYALRKPAVTEDKKDEPIPSRAREVLNPAFSFTEEAPTLVQQTSRKELHEVIADKKESLNDKLKQEKKELVHALKETPIKDLRKGIGINDRFTFINELFRGDEAMYERSIKTINGFNIYSEAEYWMNRELKLKLGWNEDHEGVQHFYHLVRRRFS